MPVTFNVSTHPANAMNRQGEYTAKEILAAACDDQYRKAEEILQFGFSCGGSEYVPGKVSVCGERCSFILFQESSILRKDDGHRPTK
jgi:hypothetical protein